MTHASPFPVPLVVSSDRLPDGSYGTTLSLGEDVAWTMPASRTTRYAAAVTALATAAEHDAAVYGSLTCKGLPSDLIGAVIVGCRDARPGTRRWTAPLVITPGIALREPHPPFLTVYHRERQDLMWQWTPGDARQHAAHVLQAATAAALDSTLAAVLASFGVDPETRAAAVDHVGGHWPTEED